MRALCLVLAFCVTSAKAEAETELQKFTATQPREIQAEFLAFQACSLLVGSKTWGRISFEESEAAIATECKKHLPFKPGQAMRSAAIEEFSGLALDERRLRSQGKPVPGYVPDPLVASTLDCVKKDNETKDEVAACFAERTGPFLRSDEPAETIATAVEGTCQGPLARYRAQLTSCIGSAEAVRISNVLVNSLRTVVISSVVQARVRP
jgi:hypothetical protein